MSISQSTPALHAAAHAGYIQKHQTKLTAAGASTRFEYWAAEPVLLSGLYWGLNTAALLGPPHDGAALDKDWAVGKIMACLCRSPETGRVLGFGGNEGHDAHVLYTLSGLQALLLCGYAVTTAEAEPHPDGNSNADDGIGPPLGSQANQPQNPRGQQPRRPDTVPPPPAPTPPHIQNRCRVTRGLPDGVDPDGLATSIAALQLHGGGFAGDEFGEDDTRHCYAAVAALSLLGRMSAIDVPAAIAYLLQCQTIDGAFGLRPGAEPHAGHTFCCLAALAILGFDLDTLPRRRALLVWLSERQFGGDQGGTNGRPGKRADVCYAWWVGASLAVLGDVDTAIDRGRLSAFVLARQLADKGGFGAHVGDGPDLFHTMFSVASLALLGHPDVLPVDPLVCLPVGLAPARR